MVQIEKFLLTSKQKRDYFSICEYGRHFDGRLMYLYQKFSNSQKAHLQYSERSQNALNIRPALGKSVFTVGPYDPLHTIEFIPDSDMLFLYS